MLTEIPQLLHISLAAKVVSLSTTAFTRHFIETGLVHLSQDLFDGRRLYVFRWELQKAPGRKLTLQECRAADAKLNPARKRQRLYQRRKGTK